jgi:hypothetical protein
MSPQYPAPQINVLTTEFADGMGRRIIARNADLVTMTITNLRRSAAAVFSLKHTVDSSITASQLEEARRWCGLAILLITSRAQTSRCSFEAYCRGRPLDWKPKVGLGVSASGLNTVDVTFTITHHASWMDSKVGPAYTDAVIFALEVCIHV